jgi:hypothetical protein
MKYILLFSLFCITFASCHKYSSAPVSANVLDTSKPYTVTTYINNGVDYTASFTSYSFQFGTDGQVVANKNGILNQGFWTLGDQTLLFRSFANNPFTAFNQSWVVKQLGLGQIKLSSTSGLDEKTLIFTQ